jgi:hypothetical protein
MEYPEISLKIRIIAHKIWVFFAIFVIQTIPDEKSDLFHTRLYSACFPDDRDLRLLYVQEKEPLRRLPEMEDRAHPKPHRISSKYPLLGIPFRRKSSFKSVILPSILW